MLTQETLRALLHYDPESGQFTWLVNRGSRARKGNVAGRITTHSGPFYREIIICRRVYQAHRLAFLYLTGAWPIGNVDHWDMNGLNNRWANLRVATLSQNAANTGRYLTNTSGFKGVTMHRQSGRWQAQIKQHGKSIYLGLFNDPAVAHAVYVAKARELFGEFARAA